MRKKLQGCIVMMTFYSAIIAQSNPTPFNLNTSGNYSFTSWASTSATGTYPANMFFHQMSATRPTITATAQSNLGAGFLYSNTDGTRIQGLDSDGILFQNKNLPVNTGYTANKMGEAVLGLVTTGREQIQVSWTAETKSSGANVTAMRLQYRIGSSGAYSDFSPISDYVSSVTVGDNATLNVTLPNSLEDLALVQLRWIYYHTDGLTNPGSRAIRLDDISVTSVPIVTFSNMPDVCANAAPFALTDGAPAGGTYSGTGVVNGDTFDPSISGTGTFVITYTYTDANNISNNASINLVVSNGACVVPIGLAANSCGAVNLLKNSYIYCESSPGAQDYQYEFSGGDLPGIVERTRGNWFTDFALNWISALNYGQTYDVRVRAKTGGIWGTYANTCTISLSAAAPSPQLQASYCNIGGLALNSYIYCTAVGGATDYRYQFTDFTDATVYTRTRGNYYTDFNLAWVTSPGRLKYNHTYNVEVAAKINGVWGAYGAVCQITTQGFPTPQLTPASCGASGLLSTDKIFTTSVGGATNYQYRFTAQGGGTPFTKFRGSNSTYYVLSWAGLAASTTYDVEVRAYAGGEWGPYGTTCTISTSQGFRFADPMAESQDGTEATKFSASVYPNPAEAGSTPYIQINGADGQKAVVRIFDIAGKECAAYTMQPVGEEFNAQMNSFAELQSGLYIITVTVNGSVQTSRLVIR